MCSYNPTEGVGIAFLRRSQYSTVRTNDSSPRIGIPPRLTHGPYTTMEPSIACPTDTHLHHSILALLSARTSPSMPPLPSSLDPNSTLSSSFSLSISSQCSLHARISPLSSTMS